jgi:hypothetical protein
MIERPHNNCYWVIPDTLMAGEYPASARPDESLAKLAAIAAAGVRNFIDLTETRDPLAPYEPLLKNIPQAREVVIGYDRFAIPDLGIPASPDLTNAILDRLDGLIAQQRIPYVHCWGGVGRTGTIVGCWLVRHGLSGDDALKHIAAHWVMMAKRHRHPRSPETSMQENYVRHWAKHDSTLPIRLA